jgi:hypothetical protein
MYWVKFGLLGNKLQFAYWLWRTEPWTRLRGLKIHWMNSTEQHCQQQQQQQNNKHTRFNNTTAPSPVQTNSARYTHSQVRESCQRNVLLLMHAKRKTAVVCWLLFALSWTQNILYLLTNYQLVPRVNGSRGRQCTNDHLDELGVDGKIVLKWIERMRPDFVSSIDVVLDEGKWRDFVKTIMFTRVP